MPPILYTIYARPYVFVFLIAFLILGVRQKGWPRTLIFLITGYTIAWLSEASSIRTGFPYGWYFYIYEAMKGEWMNWGVPVWDSVSYVFLCFAGLGLAQKVYTIPNKNLKSLIKLSLLSALFIMILDIIIDPVAHMGDRWFLGKMYYYPNPGHYFDIPVSNFAGWFLVAFLIVFTNLIIDSRFFSQSKPVRLSNQSKLLNLLDNYGTLGLYYGVFFFNWGIAIYLQEWELVLFDLFWIAIPSIALLKFSRKSHSLSQNQ